MHTKLIKIVQICSEINSYFRNKEKHGIQSSLTPKTEAILLHWKNFSTCAIWAACFPVTYTSIFATVCVLRHAAFHSQRYSI